MRLYSTPRPRRSSSCPAPPGPIGMYVCGPTVYARAHIGNARPFVIAMWCKRWLRERGYDVTLVAQHHGRQRQDLRGRARAQAPSSPRRRRDWYLEDTGRFGLGEARPLAAGDRDDRRRSSRFIEELIDARATRTRSRATSTSASRASQEYGRLSGQRPDQMEEQEPNPRKEDPRDFALWKANKPERGHLVGLALGPRPAGLAHRVLGDGGEAARAGVRDPRRRARPRLPAPRERAGAVAGARPRVRADLDAQRHAPRSPARRCRSRSATSRRSSEALDEWGRETMLLFFLTAHWRKPIDFSEETMARRRRSGAASATVFCRIGDAERRRSDGSAFAAALDDDFNTPQALALLHEWRAPASSSCCARRSSVFGLGSLAGAARHRRRCVAARRAARGGARREGLRRGGPAARRDRRARAGKSGTTPAGFRLVPQSDAASSSTAAGRCARRCAARARCSRCGRPSARSAPSPGCASRTARPGQAGARARARRPGRATTRASSLVRAVPLRGRVRARRGRAPAARLPRPGHGSAQPRRRHPQRRGSGRDGRRRAGARLGPRDGRGLPRLRGRRRALAGGRRARTSPATWTRSSAATSGSTPRPPRPSRTCGAPTSPAALALVFGAEGKGVRPLVRRACDAAVSIPLAGNVESLNVSVAAALLLYEARRQARGWLTRPSTSSTATTCCTRAFADQRELTDLLASFVAMRGARGVVVFDGGGGRSDRPARRALRAARRRRARAPRRRARATEERLPRLVRLAVRGTSGQEVQKRPRRSFLGDLEAPRARRAHGSRLGDSLDDETRARLERLRRGDV